MPPKITVIVAAAADGAIGRRGDMLWHLRADLRRFRRLTMGHPVVMGRRTWESLPGGALPGRRNIVITRTPGFRAEGAEVCASPLEALQMCEGAERVFIIGGGEIYRRMLPLADEVELTRIAAQGHDADTWFPPLSAADWKLTEASAFEASPDAPPFRFETYARRR